MSDIIQEYKVKQQLSESERRAWLESLPLDEHAQIVAYLRGCTDTMEVARRLMENALREIDRRIADYIDSETPPDVVASRLCDKWSYIDYMLTGFRPERWS